MKIKINNKPTKKIKYKYMHTLNKYPASFSGEQVCYASQYVWKLCNTLKAIRKEQALTKKSRESWGFKYDKSEYGYIKVVINR
jgi:hypothetical protein